MFLWIVIIVTLASLNAPYSVPTFFQTFLGTRDHLEPMISVYINVRPILGTPWLQIWPFIEWKSDQSGQSQFPLPCSNLVPPCSNHFVNSGDHLDLI